MAVEVLNTSAALSAKTLATLEEFAASGGSALSGFLQAGTGAVARTAQAKMRDAVSVMDFGAVADDSTNNATAFADAYTYCATNKKTLWIPAGTYRYSTGLVWNAAVDVEAEAGAILKKVGNIVGITITSEMCHIGGFQLLSLAGQGDVNDGIQVDTGGAAGLRLHDLDIRNQGQHGLLILHAALDTFERISCIGNTGDGVRLAPTASEFVSANVFIGIDVRSNGGDGLEVAGNGAGGTGGVFSNQFINVVSQNNTGYGLRSKGTLNTYQLYSESNTAGDVLFDTASSKEHLIVVSMTDASVTDNSTSNSYNTVLDVYHGIHGTWTPVIGGSGGTSGQVYGNQVGRYTKIGRLVVCHFLVSLTTKGTITTNARIEGLPFTTLSGASLSWGLGSLLFDALATNWITVNLNVVNNSTVANLQGLQAAATTNETALTTADITNTTQFRGTFAYLSNQ